MEPNITFLGGGSFGTALGIMLSKKGHFIRIWDRNCEVVEDINEKRENIRYLPNIIVPKSVKGYNDMFQAVKGADYLVLSIPSHVVRKVCRDLSRIIDKNQVIVCVAKGIEEGTGKRLSVVINEELPNNSAVILSGPSHAEEVALDIPSAVVATSLNMDYAEKVQDLFMTNKFRVYTNDDIIGVEIGGAVKNIIALAAGISDGIGFGDNTKAALMTRGMSEITRIGLSLGGKLETFSGLTGIGDMIVTCTSIHSRNRRAGMLIGSGKSMDEAVKEVGMVVEGIKACRAFYELKEKTGVSMPITNELYNVLFNSKDPKYAVYELMTRDKKDEKY